MASPQLRFKEFDGDWCISPLKNLCKINQGLQIAIEDRFLENGENRFFYITNEFLREGAKKSYFIENPPISVRCKSEDILMTRTGNTGQVVTNVEGAFHNNFFKIDFDRKQIDKNFFVEFLRKNTTQHLIIKYAGASTIPDLNHSDFYRIQMPITSIEEQTKIASFLSAVDEKISQLTQKHELLSQYKQGMMQKLFSQQIRFKADDGSDFGEWDCVQANKLFENYSNKNHDGSLTILAATQEKGVIPRDEIDIDIKSSDSSVLSYKIIEKGNFVISLRSFQGGIEYSNYYGICSPAYTVLKSIKPIDTGFYKAYLKTNDFIQRLSSTVVGIRDGKQISYQAFSTLMIDYPCPEEQTKIANFLSAIDQKIEVVTQQIEQAKQWKKGLLQQMFV